MPCVPSPLILPTTPLVTASLDSSPMRRAALLALVAVLGLAGCGGGETASPTPDTVEGDVPKGDTGGGGGTGGDAAAGKPVFASAGCGNCHVLAAAGTSGTAGPNLDESDVNVDDASEQIANGGGGMPPFKDQLSEKQIADLAAFVVESRGG